jgi:predicted DCC family thiol-disulfide oxidoreductase YuxK
MSSPRPTVFFDGGCPLCRREIAHYQKIDRQQRLHWLDISPEATDLSAYGLSRAQAMAVFHVQDARGQMHTGAAAFVRLWDELPRWRRLAQLVRILHLLPLLNAVYHRFARRRWRRRCAASACAR